MEGGCAMSKVKRKISRRGVVWVLLSWICMVSVIVVMNWSKIHPDLLLAEKAPQASSGYLRREVKQNRYVHRTMLATQSPDSYMQTFRIHGNKNDRLEVGLIHIGTENSSQSEYVFTVYELTDKEKRVVFEISGRFPTDSWKLFRTNEKMEGRSDGSLEIQYTLQPKRIRDKITSFLARAMGKPYWKDFAFLRPNAFHARKAEERNVILISFDTLRADHLGCYGYERDTSPNIDDFAGRSIRFSQAISPQPHTIPAHRSLFTGLHPLAMGKMEVRGPIDPFYELVGTFKLSENTDTLASILNENGYYTIAFTGGGTISSRFGFAKGFNNYTEYCSVRRIKNSFVSFKPLEDDTKKTFDEAIQWLQKNSDTKFFMFLHTFEAHTPYSGEFFLSNDSSESFIERRIALYDGDIRKADSYFGKLMQTLDSLGLISNSIIIFVSDHGDDFYDHYQEVDRIPRIPEEEIIPEFSKVDHGHSLYEELIHVPMIFSVPGSDPAKRVINNQVQLIDVLPTVLDLLDIEYSAPFQGVSLASLMESGSRENDAPALGVCNRGPVRYSIRKDGYKYIWIEKPEEREGIPKITWRNLRQFELFSLEDDPEEKDNIYEENMELAKKYHRILEEELEECRRLSSGVPVDDRKAQGIMEVPQDVVDALKGLGYLE